MEKLTFYYSAMNGGKSSALMQAAYNYEENGKKVLLLKSERDTKGDDYLISRTGTKRKVDIKLNEDEKLISDKYYDLLINTDCILVDEAQFLTEKQIEELFIITKQLNIPVICYGLKSNFKSVLFPGAKRLIELADKIKELDTIPLCLCGEKARFNARKVNGEFTLEGNEIEIDGSNEKIEYRPLCGSCYLKKVLKRKIN